MRTASRRTAGHPDHAADPRADRVRTRKEISDQTIYHIIQKYTREAGVRELERLIGKIVRKSVTKILIEKEEKVVVTVDNLEEFLGKVKFENNENTGKDLVGVVTGLAYTEFGGDTLQIEVAHYKGNGKVYAFVEATAISGPA